MSIVDFFMKGGPVMIPLAGCFVAAVALSIERALFFLGVLVPPKYLENVRQKLEEANYDGAIEALGKKNGPIPNILRRGISHMVEFEFHHGRRITDFERSMKEAIISEMTHIYRNNGWLGIIGQVGPLMGLLGTVTGLLNSFMVLAEVGKPDVSQLSGGIGVALITTVMGLIVGIFAFVAAEHFNLRSQSVTLEMERISVEMANAIMSAREPESGDVLAAIE